MENQFLKQKAEEIILRAEKKCKKHFALADEISLFNQEKVLKAFTSLVKGKGAVRATLHKYVNEMCNC